MARPCAIAEARADRVGERVVDADERVGEREPGDRRRVRHGRARREVVAVGVGARQRVEDQVERLQAERVGVRRREDRHAGLERVRERVDAGVGGHVRRHRERQPRVDDRDVGHERVVDERELAAAGGQHRRRRDLRAGAGRRRHGDEADRVVDLGVVRDALAGVEERQRQLARASARGSRGTAASPSRRRAPSRRRRRRSGRAAASRARRRRRGPAPRSGSGSIAANTRTRAGEVAAHLVGDAARLGVGVGDDQRLRRCAALRRLLERARVEVGVRRDAEPLRRRLPPRDRLDVEQVAVVDVVGRRSSRPRCRSRARRSASSRCRRRRARRPRSAR